MTNKLQAIRIQKQNLYTYNTINNLRKSNIVSGALSFCIFRKFIGVLVSMHERLKAIKGKTSLLLPFIFIKKDGAIC